MGARMLKNVVIVEDNDLHAKLFDDLLRGEGCKTTRTKGGWQTLTLVREHSPDLIIMDIQLPEVSGFELTKALKADAGLRHIPIVAVTAFAMKGDREKFLAAGCDDYIAKPISAPHFIQTVKGILSGRQEDRA